ncbi:LysR family transcriptional regulator [Kitasatospora sp. NPDC092286]|uniref:LysR family transcriptional regulator n=1 Tax=Kitasatospora sp. NPDC092286 TaxID=3364087 RepID=UPI003821B24D
MPIDYHRRRVLDYTGLLPEELWEQVSRRSGIHPGHNLRRKLARAVLFERISGMPADLAAPDLAVSTPSERSMPASFITDLTPDLATSWSRRLRSSYEHGIVEPITWQPPLELLVGLKLPGDDPDAVETERLHELIRNPDSSTGRVARALGTSIETVRHVLTERPASSAPRAPSQARANGDLRRKARSILPKAEFAGLYYDQQLSLLKIANKHNLSRRAVSDLAREYSIVTRRRGGPAPMPIDRAWLYEPYVTNRRTLDQIAEELGMSGSNLLYRAHNLDIPMRPGDGASHASTLAVQAKATAAPLILQKVMTGYGAPERLRRFAVMTSHRSMAGVAREIGARSSTLFAQLNRIEREIGGNLFHRPRRPLVLTPLGERLLAAIRCGLQLRASMISCRPLADHNITQTLGRLGQLLALTCELRADVVPHEGVLPSRISASPPDHCGDHFFLGDRPGLVVLGGTAVPVIQLVCVVVTKPHLDIPVGVGLLRDTLDDQERVSASEIGHHGAHRRLRGLLDPQPSLIHRYQHALIIPCSPDNGVSPVDRAFVVDHIEVPELGRAGRACHHDLLGFSQRYLVEAEQLARDDGGFEDTGSPLTQALLDQVHPAVTAQQREALLDQSRQVSGPGRGEAMDVLEHVDLVFTNQPMGSVLAAP